MAMFEKNHFQKTGSVRPKKILLPCFQLMRITPPRPIEPLLIQPFKEVEVGNNILIEAEVLQQIGAIEPSKGFIEAIIGQLSCLDCTQRCREESQQTLQDVLQSETVSQNNEKASSKQSCSKIVLPGKSKNTIQEELNDK